MLSISWISKVLSVAALTVSQFVFAQDQSVQVPSAATQAAASGQSAPNGMMLNMLLLGGMVLFMWLFIIRPQSKRQKEHKNFINSLAVGQEVITQSGMIGKISSMSDKIVTVDFGNGPVRVLKSSISAEINPNSLTSENK